MRSRLVAMTDIRTVRASGPADLLALVPRLLGFHPQDSVVVITVGDAIHRFHARVDLPADPITTEEVTSYLVDVASQNGVRAGCGGLLRRRSARPGGHRRPVQTDAPDAHRPGLCDPRRRSAVVAGGRRARPGVGWYALRRGVAPAHGGGRDGGHGGSW